MHRSDRALLGPGRLCMAPWQPHTPADDNPPSGRTVCDLWDCVTALQIWSSPAEAQTWPCICYFWNVVEQKSQGSFPLFSLSKFFHHWPELEGATGLSHLQIPDPVTAEVFSQPPLIGISSGWWAPSILPRRIYFPEKTKLLMSREIISLRPVLWSFGYTPYLVCCWEGVVSVFCIWHVDGNS